MLSNTNLYFININENVYYELVSQKSFERVDKEIYCNNETGLYFNFNDLTIFNNSKTLLKKLKSNLYNFYINDYFNTCLELNEKDNDLRSKSYTLLLKNAINMRK